jgi:hypothetical protein
LKLILNNLLFLFIFSSCAAIESFENLNHTAMDISIELNVKSPSLMTGLTDFSSIAGGSGCSTCAH